jgi:hypothetical protein
MATSVAHTASKHVVTAPAEQSSRWDGLCGSGGGGGVLLLLFRMLY